MSDDQADVQTQLHQAFSDALAELPTKRRQFVIEYLKDLNGTQAAIRAGYAEPTAHQQASRLLTFVKVDTAVRAGLALKAMPADEVLARLADHARGSLEPFINRNSDGEFTGIDLSDGKPLHLIKEATITKRTYDDDSVETTVKIKVHDPQAALVHLGRHHKLFTDTVETSGDVTIRVEYADPDTRAT